MSSKYYFQMASNQVSSLPSDRQATHRHTHTHTHACMLTLAHIHKQSLNSPPTVHYTLSRRSQNTQFISLCSLAED